MNFTDAVVTCDFRDEIRESTSSMTSVPKPLKFLRPHVSINHANVFLQISDMLISIHPWLLLQYHTVLKPKNSCCFLLCWTQYPELKDVFEAMMDGENKTELSDVLSVLGMTMAGSGTRESLKYKLTGSKSGALNGLDLWGFEYVKNLSGEIGQEWDIRRTAGTDTSDLKVLVEEIVPFNMKHNSEPDACDLLMEVDMIERILEHITESNFPRVALYLTNCANYVAEPEDRIIFKVVYDVYRKVDRFPEALRIAIRLNDQALAQEVFDACPNEMAKKQLCFMIARYGTLSVTTDDDDLLAIMGNASLSEHFLSLGRDLDVFEAKTPEDIYKTHLTEQRVGAANVDSARANLASTFVNAFVNAGYGHDTLMTGESKWIYKNKEHGTMSAAASLGMILLWDVDSGLSQIDKFTYSDSDYIKAGASLAVGIVSANVRSECDPALALMADKVDAENSTIQRIGASLGLGMAYAGTQKEEILDILTPVIADPATPIELFSLAALSLGLVFVGTGKADIAETIMTGMMEREEKVMEDTMARFACLGLGLLFLGLQEAADVTMEALKAVPGQIGQYCSFTVETCAYAGSGNVMKVQKLLGVCAEHLETNNSHQAVALLGIALIAQGEEIGAEMTARSFEHMLQYGEVNLRRVVPLAVGLLHLSNPKPQVIDMLSKLSHDGDAEVAQAAIMALGLVGAGTNNSRVALLLRQLSTYYGKDPNNTLFVVRIAQGLLHMGKGLMTLSLLHSDRLITSPTALAGAMAVMHACLDFKNIILGKYHYLLFLLAPAMQPRMLVTLDQDLKPLPVSVRVGQAVDVVGQAGKPKSITGFATHTTPVLLAYDQRAELATEQYIPLTSVLEGFVILKENPDWKAAPEASPTKKKDEGFGSLDDDNLKKMALKARNVRPDQRMYDK